MTVEMFLILMLISISLICGCLIHTIYLQKKLYKKDLKHLTDLCSHYDILLNLIVKDFNIDMLKYVTIVEDIKKKGGVE